MKYLFVYVLLGFFAVGLMEGLAIRSHKSEPTLVQKVACFAVAPLCAGWVIGGK